jgi:hypothetical protein
LKGFEISAPQSSVLFDLQQRWRFRFHTTPRTSLSLRMGRTVRRSSSGIRKERRPARRSVYDRVLKHSALMIGARLLHKIDFFILTYGCLAYFTKWLDQANLSNAYVSGMREDLNMQGTDYNLAVTCFQVGKISLWRHLTTAAHNAKGKSLGLSRPTSYSLGFLPACCSPALKSYGAYSPSGRRS